MEKSRRDCRASFANPLCLGEEVPDLIGEGDEAISRASWRGSKLQPAMRQANGLLDYNN